MSTIIRGSGDTTFGGTIQSTGIDDNATSTAITIDSAENVGIGTTTPSTGLSVVTGSANGIELGQDSDLSTDSSRLFFSTSAGSNSIVSHSGALGFNTGATAGSSSGTERLSITSDGRGLSQFTAKVWISFQGEGTAAINDSHNVSTLSDGGTGKFTVNFSNNMANSNYAVVSGFADGGGFNDNRTLTHENSQERSTSAYALYFLHSNGALDDPEEASLVIFGD